MEKVSGDRNIASYKPRKGESNDSNTNVFFEKLGLPPRGNALYALLHKGFDYQVYKDLSKYLRIQKKEFNSLLDFAPATVDRRRLKGFTLGESDVLYRLAEVSSAAIDLFEGDEDKARTWLKTPVKGIDNKRPVDMAITSAETAAVIDLIGRLEYGVLS
ncbi:MAG: DUF2384 domain-containing protein [Pseudomonadota bacterium]